jgi:hypothetical protein
MGGGKGKKDVNAKLTTIILTLSAAHTPSHVGKR